MASCVGLTSGAGGAGAFITSRMSWGGLLYPDAPFAGTEVALDADGFDCAAIDKQVVQTMSAAANIKLRTLWNLIIFLRLYSQANPK
jgi:hypothetical protein